MASQHWIPVERLRAAVGELVRGFGSEPREVDLVAENLLQANLTGHDSHGVGMLPRYAKAACARTRMCSPPSTAVRCSR